jgi:hypothetical protein
MSVFIRKIRIKIRIYQIKFKSARPQYSRLQWYFKGLMLIISALGFQLAGLKINDIELNLYYGKIVSYGPDYIFYMGVEGLFLALALWRLLEIYWWAKNRAVESASL